MSVQTCPACQRGNPLRNKSCWNCGAALPIEGNEKQEKNNIIEELNIQQQKIDEENEKQAGENSNTQKEEIISTKTKKKRRSESFPSVLEVIILNILCCGFVGYVRLGQTNKGLIICLSQVACLIFLIPSAGLTLIPLILLGPATLVDSFMCAQYQLETGIPLDEYTFFPRQR